MNVYARLGMPRVDAHAHPHIICQHVAFFSFLFLFLRIYPHTKTIRVRPFNRLIELCLALSVIMQERIPAASSSSNNPPVTRRPSSLKRRSTREILSSVDDEKPTMPLVKHGKYVLVGSVGCWWVELPEAMRRVMNLDTAWVK